MSEEKKITKTAADKIWEEIKDKRLDIFALPGQVVSMHCQPVNIEPTKLYLSYRAPSLIVSLEDCLGTGYKVSTSDKYITVSKG